MESFPSIGTLDGKGQGGGTSMGDGGGGQMVEGLAEGHFG